MAYDMDREPGTWVGKQAAHRSGRVWFLAGLLVAVSLASVGLTVSKRATVLSSVLIIAIAVLLKLKADRAVDKAMPWRWGAKAEKEVGAVLNELRNEGFVVMHDIEQCGEGNIDHLVSGPTGVYLIETKSHRYAEGAPLKAKRQAAKVHDSLGVWVTPVICVHRRRKPAFQAQGVWVLPQREVLDWIRKQRNRPVEFERLARWADTL